MGMSIVTPEHICLAICNSRNTSAVRVLRSYVPYLFRVPVAVVSRHTVLGAPLTIQPQFRLGVDMDIVKREARRRIQTMREAEAKKSVTKARSPFSPFAACALQTLEHSDITL